LKVILLKPNFSANKGFLGSNYFVLPNIDIGTIASILSNEGHEALIKDPFLEGMDFEDTVSFITGNHIDIVGITTVTMHYEGAIQLAREVKKRCQSIITILGGPHFQGIGEECLEKNLFLITSVLEKGIILSRISSNAILMWRVFQVFLVWFIEMLVERLYPTEWEQPKTLTNYPFLPKIITHCTFQGIFLP
jgi:hypothetical protein